jgi:hypothetical protein
MNYELFADSPEEKPAPRVRPAVVAFPAERSRHAPKATGEEVKLRHELRRAREALIEERTRHAALRRDMFNPVHEPAAPITDTARVKRRVDWESGLFGALGCGCLLMSIYHTNTFLLFGGKSPLIAGVTAGLTATFSAAAFYGGNRALRRRAYSGLLLYPLALLIIAFSIFSTIAVSFEQLKEREAASVEARELTAQTAELLASNAQEQADLEQEAARIIAGLPALRDEVKYWRDKNWVKHDRAGERIVENEARIAEIKVRKSGLMEEARALSARSVETVRARGRTIYAFMAGVSGISEAVLRFTIFCIPAIFFDVASPLLLGVALALGDRWKE